MQLEQRQNIVVMEYFKRFLDQVNEHPAVLVVDHFVGAVNQLELFGLEGVVSVATDLVDVRLTWHSKFL